jgi:hypothetical protein
VIALALLGCVTRAVPPALPDDVASVATVAVALPAGEVREGAYVDLRGVEVPLVPGWSPRVGRTGDALRLVQVAPPAGEGGAQESELRVELWAYTAREGEPLAPRPRPGCAWTFRDQGSYLVGEAAPGAPPPRVVATCTPPLEPLGDAPWVLAWITACGDVAWHVELVAPAGRVGEGLDLVAPVRRCLRCAGTSARGL